MLEKPLFGTIIVTYRCNAGCIMCGCHENGSDPKSEISPEIIRKLPKMRSVSITGGEPFLREDLPEIVRELYKKTNRVVVSTNGTYPERIIKLCEAFPRLGIRISLDGIGETNDRIRGIPGGFDRCIKILVNLKKMKHPDIGIGVTIQDENIGDLLSLYRIADQLGVEFATSMVHNSFHFHKYDNTVVKKNQAKKALKKLIRYQLSSSSPKDWFRAYYNQGLLDRLDGKPCPLPCVMGRDAFFLDPYGDVLPCNGMSKKLLMGNLKTRDWDDIWWSPLADLARHKVGKCPHRCWMACSASPAMHRYFPIPAIWVAKRKAVSLVEASGL